jgi:hypothetical protein
MMVVVETCTKLELCGVILFLAAKGYKGVNTYCRMKAEYEGMHF